MVYDLGCGDGRLVVTAVQKFGCQRGVGIDMLEDLVKVSRERAAKAGVADKTEFRVGNVLEIEDLSSATVVFLYMGEEINASAQADPCAALHETGEPRRVPSLFDGETTGSRKRR